MQWFRVDLKTFLGLTMLNQRCHGITKLILGGGIFRQEIPNLNDPYIYDLTFLPLYCEGFKII